MGIRVPCTQCGHPMNTTVKKHKFQVICSRCKKRNAQPSIQKSLYLMILRYIKKPFICQFQKK